MAAISGAIQDDPSHVVSWLPMFHDMGLIGAVLHAAYTGGSCTLLSPLAFLQRPGAWLRAISRYRATVSASPNFGYELAARKVRPAELAGLDLSGWRTALSGAEPVRAETFARFLERFAPCGLRADALFPAYGLAEATLLVTGGARGGPPRVGTFDAGALERGVAVAQPDGRAIVSCGPPSGVEIAVVADGRACSEGAVGEIWLRGPGVTAGYWRRPDDTARVFGARLGDGDPWMRTGDLGFLRDGELFVTGRAKDLIIVRGANHYPNDVERTVEDSHLRLRPGCAAAFGVEVAGEERVVVAVEVDERGGPVDAAAITTAVRAAVLAIHGLGLHEVALLRARTLPKTSSGKVQRRATRAAYLAGTLDRVDPNPPLVRTP